MKKILFITLTSILCLSLTSCLDLYEEITLNADGSGSYALQVDAMKIADRLSAFDPEGKKEGYNLIKEDEKPKMDSMAQAFNAQAGISDFNYVTEGAITTFKFKFERLSQIYKIMDDVFANTKSPSKAPITLTSFNMNWVQEGSRCTVNRAAVVKSPDEMNAQEKKKDAFIGMFKAFFVDGSYTSVIHFPAKVKVKDNKEIQRSKGKKSLSISANLTEVLEKPAIVAFTAKYKVGKK